MSDYKITDNRPQVKKELTAKIALALELIGQKAEGYAKDDTPVDTGRLRNSISNKVDGNDVYIGTNVEYAPYVEFNDDMRHETGKAHFLRDAATTHGDEYKRIAELVMKGL